MEFGVLSLDFGVWPCVKDAGVGSFGVGIFAPQGTTHISRGQGGSIVGRSSGTAAPGNMAESTGSKIMNQEKPVKISGEPQQEQWRIFGLSPLLFTLYLIFGMFCVVVIGGGLVLIIAPPPWDTMQVSGTVVILDESGHVLPYQPSEVWCYPVWTPTPILRRGGFSRQLFPDASGKFHVGIPEFPAMLFAGTQDGKYGAIVNLSPDQPTTGLFVELRPRYSVKVRLVDQEGNPLADQEFPIEEFSMSCSRYHDPGRRSPFERKHSTGHSCHYVRTKMGADGFFTIENVIPGADYMINVPSFEHGRYAYYLDTPDTPPHVRRFQSQSIVMPVLLPEQYQEPYSLGDIVILRQNEVARESQDTD